MLLDAELYLPMVFMYFDDVQDIEDNAYCGEFLAINELNADPHPMRRLGRANFLNELRIFKRAIWHKQIYIAQVFVTRSARSLTSRRSATRREC